MSSKRKPKTKRLGETAKMYRDLKKHQSYDINSETIYSLCIPGTNGLFGPFRFDDDFSKLISGSSLRDKEFMDRIGQPLRKSDGNNLPKMIAEVKSRSRWQQEIFRLFRKREYVELVNPDYYSHDADELLSNGKTPTGSNQKTTSYEKYQYVLERVKALPEDAKVVAISTSQGSAILLKCLEDVEFCQRIKAVTFVSPAYTVEIGPIVQGVHSNVKLDMKKIGKNIGNLNIFGLLLNTQIGWGGDKYGSAQRKSLEAMPNISHYRFCTTDHGFDPASQISIDRNKILTVMKIVDVMYTNIIQNQVVHPKLKKYLEYIQQYFNEKDLLSSSGVEYLHKAMSEEEYLDNEKSQSSDLSSDQPDLDISELMKKNSYFQLRKQDMKKAHSENTCAKFNGQPIKCNAYSKGGVHCYYGSRNKCYSGIGKESRINDIRSASRKNKVLRDEYEQSAALMVQRSFRNKSKLPKVKSDKSSGKSTNKSTGTSPCTKFHGQPIKCNSYSKDDVHCYYTASKVKGKVGSCRKGSAQKIDESRSKARNNPAVRDQFEQSAASVIQRSFRNKSKLPKSKSKSSDRYSRSSSIDRDSYELYVDKDSRSLGSSEEMGYRKKFFVIPKSKGSKKKKKSKKKRYLKKSKKIKKVQLNNPQVQVFYIEYILYKVKKLQAKKRLEFATMIIDPKHMDKPNNVIIKILEKLQLPPLNKSTLDKTNELLMRKLQQELSKEIKQSLEKIYSGEKLDDMIEYYRKQPKKPELPKKTKK